MASVNPALADIKGDVAQRLEANGTLDHIRVQIRASVYRALLASEDVRRDAPVVPVSLVADFLQRQDLAETREVFLKEANEMPLDRFDLAKDLGACMEPPDPERAVLEQVVTEVKRRGGDAEVRSNKPPTIHEEPTASGAEELSRPYSKAMARLKGAGFDISIA